MVNVWRTGRRSMKMKRRFCWINMLAKWITTEKENSEHTKSWNVFIMPWKMKMMPKRNKMKKNINKKLMTLKAKYKTKIFY